MPSSFWNKLPKSVPEAPKICVDFLNNKCQAKKSTCLNVHTMLAFLWQVERLGKWHNFPSSHNKQLELEFRVPSSDGVYLAAEDPLSGEEHFSSKERWYADFDKMTLEGSNQRMKIRRLSTESAAVNNDQFCTKYSWHLKNERNRWVLFGESVGRRNSNNKKSAAPQTPTSSDDIEYQVSVNKRKVWSTRSAQNAFEFDFVKMTQTNQQTQVARPIRRRPVASKIITGSGDSSDITPSPMPESFVIKEHKWQFMDEQNQWIDYGCVSSGNDNSCVVSATSKGIEKEFERNPKGNVQIQSASNRYTLDFLTMKQTNCKTKVTRDVRRVLETSCNAGNKSEHLKIFENDNEEVDKFSSSEYEWFFLNDNSRWVKYGKASLGNDQNSVTSQGSDDIENHYRTRFAEVMTIKSNQHTYELDFSILMQTNVKTRVQRAMSRQAKKGGGGGNYSSDDIAVSMHVVYEWYIKDDDGSWVKYGCKGNAGSTFGSNDIEKHYRQTPTTNLNVNLDSGPHVIDFASMTQKNTATGKTREIHRRRVLASINGVSTTTVSMQNFALTPGPKVFSTPLSATDGEYTAVLQQIRSTAPNCTPKQIYKVHNPYLKAVYENRRLYMKSMYPGIAYNEYTLFHGTNANNIKTILEENIDWRLHGTQHGQVMGRGVYFSNSAQVSLGYGQVLFICKVLVGLVTTGNQNTVRPPRDASNQVIDTVVNQLSNPNVYVKFDTQEYFPQYYVEC